MKIQSLLHAAATVALFVTSAQAGIVIDDLYKLGEADSPPGVAGNPGNATTVDSGLRGINLTASGSPTYSSNTAAPGSTISMQFGGSDQYASANVLTTQTTNVGISAWIYPTVSDVPSIIAYNGNTNSSGFGLLEYLPAATSGEAHIIGLLGGVSFGPSVDIPLNQWTYVTQLLVGGKDELFVNNVLTASVNGVPNTPTGNFVIGAGFTGNIDQVQIFTPEPSALMLLGLGVAGLFVAARRRRA